MFHWKSGDGFELVSSLETLLTRSLFKICVSQKKNGIFPPPINKASTRLLVSFQLGLYRSHRVMTNFHMTCRKNILWERWNDKGASPDSSIKTFSQCKVTGLYQSVEVYIYRTVNILKAYLNDRPATTCASIKQDNVKKWSNPENIINLIVCLL